MLSEKALKRRKIQARQRRIHNAIFRLDLKLNRNVQEQLVILDKRLGQGVGAQKERARIKALCGIP